MFQLDDMHMQLTEIAVDSEICVDFIKLSGGKNGCVVGKSTDFV